MDRDQQTLRETFQNVTCPRGRSFSVPKPYYGRLVRSADAANEGAGAVAGDIDEFLIGSQLVQKCDETVGFGKLLVVVISLDLEHHVVYAEPVITHGALEVGQIGFLTGETFED